MPGSMFQDVHSYVYRKVAGSAPSEETLKNFGGNSNVTRLQVRLQATLQALLQLNALHLHARCIEAFDIARATGYQLMRPVRAGTIPVADV